MPYFTKFQKWLYQIALCVITFLLILFVWHHPKSERTELPLNLTEVSNASLTPLGEHRTFVLSAYYDTRDQSAVRVLVILHHQEVKELFCRFRCSTRGEHSITSRAELDIHPDRFGFPYGMADLLCPVPEDCDAKYLSIHRSTEGNDDQLPKFEIKNRYAEPFSANFTVCISALHGGFNNALQFIQTMEMYKLLGAQRVTIYKLYRNCCSDTLEEVLRYYTEEGTLEVIPWPIDLYFRVSRRWQHSDSDDADIGYFGQISTLNDCMYRNMYKSKFISLNDIDEIILPFEHQDWGSMMVTLQQQNPKATAFLFENHVFPSTMLELSVNTPSWNTTPGVNLLQCVYREPKGTNHRNRKMIIDPRKVMQVSVHHITKAVGMSHEVSSDIAILHHCKKTPQPELTKESLIKDTTIWRYRAPLTQSVNKVIDAIATFRKTKYRAEGLQSEKRANL
ncbi:beta-1,4-galactosyltransferase galt-1-like [Ambystoma mexicanum]|uniref:beta-1,4-galactosyltransferase galt-1-like n=1 Tax=Ambystoma mexicanum TaxID=8296 RepID=UPI0037E9189D